jgi:hypothetical protein
MSRSTIAWLAAAVAAASTLLACGGGGGGMDAMAPAPQAATPSGAAPGAVSSGSITAFGSIFVNGHEFGTTGAQLVDADTGSASSDLSSLEVGMSVDVHAAAASTPAQPLAAEIDWHPLARGYVDASDLLGSTITVMGQTVMLTAATGFSDHRACVGASTSPCTAITGQSGLAATTGSGSSAVAGSYVTVHGYLYSASAGSAGIVATLVSVGDVPAASVPVAYKAEGVLSAVAGSTLTLGGLSVNLAGAQCYASGKLAPCATAFSSGQTVSVFGATAPALPAVQFTAGTALLRSKLLVATAGTPVELEGMVSSVTTSPPAFVLRGVAIDASALPATSLPALGDQVRVLGTVASGGQSVSATAVTVLHAARSASFGFEGDFSSVAAGSASNTDVLMLLGQSIAVNAGTQLADRSAGGGGRGDTAAHPFNITTFQTYLTASTSKHLLVRTQADAYGNLSALSVVIVPAAATASVSGTVDATPAPVNSSATGTPSLFSVHGVAVSADPAAVVDEHDRRNALTSAVAAGDFVLVRGSWAAGQISVAAPASGKAPAPANVVIDEGPATAQDHGFF